MSSLPELCHDDGGDAEVVGDHLGLLRLAIGAATEMGVYSKSGRSNSNGLPSAWSIKAKSPLGKSSASRVKRISEKYFVNRRD